MGCRAAVAAQSIGSTAQQWPAQQQLHSRAAPALQHAQPSLFTVSTQAQHAGQASLGPAAQGPSGLRLQLPLRAAQQHQLQAHLQLQHQAQIDLAIGSLAEKQVTQASSSAVEQQRSDAATCGAPSSWAQRLISSQIRLESSCGAHDSSATGTCSCVHPHDVDSDVHVLIPCPAHAVISMFCQKRGQDEQHCRIFS